jgi:hypothetical protein
MVPNPWESQHPDDWDEETMSEVAKQCRQVCIDSMVDEYELEKTPNLRGEFELRQCIDTCVENTMEAAESNERESDKGREDRRRNQSSRRGSPQTGTRIRR